MSHDDKKELPMEHIAQSPSDYARNADLDSDKLAAGRGLVLGIFGGFAGWGLIALIVQAIR